MPENGIATNLVVIQMLCLEATAIPVVRSKMQARTATGGVVRQKVVRTHGNAISTTITVK